MNSLAVPPADFATRLVKWQRQHGRHDLPWQASRDPYAVWLSEIMLQQTQVATVKSYFLRFMARYPTVHALAQARLDDVLGLWSGLGYYSRARNLHACAQQVVTQFGGQFPQDVQSLQTLAGIGPSTAAAIASLCFEKRQAILDGNVKRVLTRVLGFAGDLSQGAALRELADWAQQMLPQQSRHMPRYTQGLMDLGATVCLPRRPDCANCPMQTVCVAHAQGQALRYPVKTRKLKRSAESVWLLHLCLPTGEVCLVQRPEKGIWARLFCLPMFASESALLAALPARLRAGAQVHAPFTHVLTHKDLHVHVVHVRASAASRVPTGMEGNWFAPAAWQSLGLPAPVRKLLDGAVQQAGTRVRRARGAA